MAIKADKLLNRPSELHRRYAGRLAMKEDLQKRMVQGGSTNIVLTKKTIKSINIIKDRVIEIDSLLKGTLAIEKKKLDTQKRQESNKRKEKQEEKLETKPQAEKGPIKAPSLPRMGFFAWVKNFIGNIILGYFAVRLVKFLPLAVPIVKFIGKATDFVIDIGGKLLDGLVTFIDWGYKAIDFTRGMMKNLGGMGAVKAFDGFTGAVGNLVETAIIAATVIANQGDGGGNPLLDMGQEFIEDKIKNRLLQRGAQTVAQQAGGAVAEEAGLGVAATAGIIAGVGLIASAVGELGFQIRKVAIKPIQDAKKAYDNEKNPLMKIGRGAFLGGMNALLAPLSIFGVILDVVGAPFRYAIELLRYPFLSEEDKQKQAKNLAKFDARIREDLRKALNMLTLGFAFKEKGSFGNIYGNKGAQKEMMGTMSKMAGGGGTSRGSVTRGGKAQGGVKRVISSSEKGKYKRTIPQKPGKVEITSPGADIGGKDKLFGIFPNPLAAAQKVVDAINPFKTVKDAGEELGKTDYFGPILAISSKITAGQKPSQQDYQNVGRGLNLLIAKGIQDKQLKGGIVAKFAEGGMVDPDILSAAETGGDISNWVAKTFQGEIESNAQRTLRLIRENADKKKEQPSESTTPGMGGGPGGSGGQFSMTGIQGDIYKYLLSKGLNDILSLGIMANIHRESGFRPGASESGGPGVGLFQYSSGGRKSAFLKAVPDYAINWKGQIDFALKDDVGPQYTKMKFDSPQAAADWWMRKWERPAEYIQNDKGPKIHTQYLAGLQKFKTQKGYEIPTSDSIGLGSGYGSAGSKIAGELGRFVKKKGVVPGSIHEHPEFGGIKYKHAPNSYHYQGRAIDLGGYANEQGPILKAVADFNRMKNVKPVELLKAGDPGHSDHVHVAYEKGGETLGYPHLAMLGERGKETVIDADSSVPEAKDMLLAINQAKDSRSVMKAIQQYAPYDALAPQTIIMQSPQPQTSSDGYGSDSDTGGGLVAMGSENEESSSFDALYIGG